MTKEGAKGGDGGRLGFVDDARGLAVVLMIFWHTVDGWIRLDLHAANPRVRELMVVFGGTAAPLFVMLAGVGAAMKLLGDQARSRPVAISAAELFTRGLHVMTTGYALRVYCWIVDQKAMYRATAAPAYVPIVIGLLCLSIGFDHVAQKPKKHLPLIGVGAAFYAWGISRAFVLEPNSAPFLLKVDVLQAIGASLALIALLDPILGVVRRPWLALLLGCAVAVPTSLVAPHLPGDLPPAIAAYVARWGTPFGARVAAFPLLPWFGYSLVGVTLGNVWVRASRAGRTEYVLFASATVAAGVAAIANGPPIHRWVIPNAPALYAAMFMLHKIGFALALVLVLSMFWNWIGRYPLRDLGKASMVVYLVHLEFAYGRVAHSIKHTFDYGEWAVRFVLLTLAMAVVAVVRLRLPGAIDALRARHSASRTRSS